MCLTGQHCFDCGISQPGKRALRPSTGTWQITWLHWTLGLFTYAADVTGHNGQNPHRLYVPRIRTNYGKRSLQYRATLIWNHLSVELYNGTSVRQFKSFILFCVIIICMLLYFACFVCMLSCNCIVCYLQGTAEKQTLWLMLYKYLKKKMRGSGTGLADPAYAGPKFLISLKN